MPCPRTSDRNFESKVPQQCVIGFHSEQRRCFRDLPRRTLQNKIGLGSRYEDLADRLKTRPKHKRRNPKLVRRGGAKSAGNRTFRSRPSAISLIRAEQRRLDLATRVIALPARKQLERIRDSRSLRVRDCRNARLLRQSNLRSLVRLGRRAEQRFFKLVSLPQSRLTTTKNQY